MSAVIALDPRCGRVHVLGLLGAYEAFVALIAQSYVAIAERFTVINVGLSYPSLHVFTAQTSCLGGWLRHEIYTAY